jgi:mono/diheme cytochrome c family protein
MLRGASPCPRAIGTKAQSEHFTVSCGSLIKRDPPLRFILGFIAALVAVIGAALAVTYTGSYNVAANVPDAGIVRWFLSTNMQRSVMNHAQGIKAPAQLTDEQARKGFQIYKETCVYCHGAPGKDPGDIAKGLNPEPPYLPDTVGGWTSAQLFWIIKNGIKMTGMASYGAVHNDDEIWSLVAFVQKLPKMTPEEYAKMEQTPGG